MVTPSVAILVLIKMTSLVEVSLIPNFVEDLEQYLGEANTCMRLLLTSRTINSINIRIYWDISVSWYHLQQCLDWQVDQHYWQVVSRAAADHWQSQYRYLDDDW